MGNQTSNSHKSTTDGTDLNHSRDIGLDVGLLDVGVRLIVDSVLEVGRVESTRDETLIDTTGRTKHTERDDSKPQTPVEDALGLAEVFQTKDVDGFLDTTCHVDGDLGIYTQT